MHVLVLSLGEAGSDTGSHSPPHPHTSSWGCQSEPREPRIGTGTVELDVLPHSGRGRQYNGSNQLGVTFGLIGGAGLAWQRLKAQVL